MAGSNEFRNRLEERLGTEEYERIGQRGLQGKADQKNKNVYSAAEVISEFRNRPKGVKVDEGDNSMVNYFQGLVNDGSKFNLKARDYLKSKGVTFGKNGGDGDGSDNPADPVTSAPEQTTNNGSGSGRGGNMSPSQDVNQDNDITTTIDGNDNTVNNTQDNSVTQNNIDNSDNSRHYGGSNRFFSYKGGDGLSRLYDTPVSMATMGGYYDVDDSPSANAKFVDMYTDLNNLNQRESDKHWKATGNFNYSSDESRAFNPVNMMNRIDSAPQRSYDMADREAANLFGDMWKWKNTMPQWQMPTPGKPVEMDLEGIAEEYTDKIK